MRSCAGHPVSSVQSFSKLTAQKEWGESQQNAPLTEMLDVGASDDIDIPPLERVGEEQQNNENQDQNQMHAIANAPTANNGVGEPEQSQQIATH